MARRTILSLGVDVRKSMILNALHTVFKPDGIIERSDAPVRRLEGLEESTGVLSGSVPNLVCIEENGALFEIDLAGGQKTGWFLDQRANRRAAARYATSQRVLDMFCNQGGFSVLAAKAGAASVLAVDSSADALELLRRNALRNGVADRITTIEANAFDYLRDLEKMGQRFGLIILDPPAFAKNRASLEGGAAGLQGAQPARDAPFGEGWGARHMLLLALGRPTALRCGACRRRLRLESTAPPTRRANTGFRSPYCGRLRRIALPKV